MQKRYVTIWFQSLTTDWFIRKQPGLKEIPFVLALPDHGRLVVTAANNLANKEGIEPGMAVADARTLISSLKVIDARPGLNSKLLKGFAEWCIRYSPYVAVDLPDGIILDASGCAHLWGGEKQYIFAISKRLRNFGYHIRIAIADTIGAAWAVSRFGKDNTIVEKDKQIHSLQSLPVASLRIEPATTEVLQKLGLYHVDQLTAIPRSALRRRFDAQVLLRIDQALGNIEELIQPVFPPEPYHERLPCLEPIVTATGIGIALQRLLNAVCHRLQQEEKGLRIADFKCYRIDGKIEKISIGTNRPSNSSKHLYKLFENKIDSIEPDLGIELFILEASKIEDLATVQEKLWDNKGLDDTALAELLDRIGGKVGNENIHRYLPAEHYWPERSFKPATSVIEKAAIAWKIDRPRPLQLL
ncbi:MAG: DNA polymerase Y family protein [Ginsengibacter sp.]